MDYDNYGTKSEEHSALKYDYHLRSVLNDPEFRKEVQALNDKHEELALSSGEKYQNGLAKFPELYEKTASLEWSAISDKYHIDDLTISIYLHGYYYDEHWPVGGYVNLLESSTDSIILNLNASVTYKEYVALWKVVQKHKSNYGTNQRRRNPENTELIYAIYKARKKLTFRAIFGLYSSGNLPFFHGSSSQYKDEDSLERYYDKYKPAN